MAVPTLPVIGTPSIVFFYILEGLAFTIVDVLLTAAGVSTFVLICPVFATRLYRICNNNGTPRQCGPSSCCGYMKTVFLSMGRLLCVNTFPALFKMHKTRSDHGNQTRKFMVFLDRKVESSLTLIAAFCSIVYSILFTSSLIFLRYFPVEQSEECNEKDNHDRSLFCYSTSSNSSLPVDCAKYTVTELQELHFRCYALALPNGLGIAVAAALGLAKVATVGITIFVKVTEGYFKMTKNDLPLKLLKWCCGGSRKCANRIYIISSTLLLLALSGVSLSCMIVYSTHTIVSRNHDLKPLQYLHYSAYVLLPILLYGPLGYIVKYLAAHCDKGEYVSFAADQRPLDPHDWDVESGSSMTAGQQDEASTGGASGNTSGTAANETEELLLIETKGNTKDTEFGATQV